MQCRGWYRARIPGLGNDSRYQTSKSEREPQDRVGTTIKTARKRCWIITGDQMHRDNKHHYPPSRKHRLLPLTPISHRKDKTTYVRSFGERRAKWGSRAAAHLCSACRRCRPQREPGCVGAAPVPAAERRVSLICVGKAKPF